MRVYLLSYRSYTLRNAHHKRYNFNFLTCGNKCVRFLRVDNVRGDRVTSGAWWDASWCGCWNYMNIFPIMVLSVFTCFNLQIIWICNQIQTFTKCLIRAWLINFKVCTLYGMKSNIYSPICCCCCRYCCGRIDIGGAFPFVVVPLWLRKSWKEKQYN